MSQIATQLLDDLVLQLQLHVGAVHLLLNGDHLPLQVADLIVPFGHLRRQGLNAGVELDQRICA